MQIISKKNFIIFLAAALVIALGVMALSLTRRPKQQRTLTQTGMDKEIQQIRTQSNSDDIGDIEKDLNDTDLIDIDKDLQDIENELDSTTL